MIDEEKLSHFATRGWMLVDLDNPSAVFDVRDRLLDHLRETSLPELERLEDYHLLVPDSDRHTQVLFDLCRFYWAEALGTTMIASHLRWFQDLIGPDLRVQKYPYLRAIRPGQDGDAVLLHRDTYYGSSPYEIAVFIPFNELTRESALRVVPGSHVEPDSTYPWKRGSGGGVTPGSAEHQLGFPYAPKLLDPQLVERAEAIPMRVGQALLFSLSLVHGGGTNAGNATRFSTDIRVVNAFAPIEWSHSVHEDYYVDLCSSLVTRLAQRYLGSNSS